MSMAKEPEIEIVENKTHEVKLTFYEGNSTNIKRRLLYRFWPADEDGNWAMVILDSSLHDEGGPALYIPKEVIDVLLREKVKGDLKR